MADDKNKMNKKTIVLAAGGTGGHLFPAEALAEELAARGHKVVILTDKRGEAFKSLDKTIDIHIVRSAALKPGLVSKIKSGLDMTIGVFEARGILKKYKPDAVVGFGGYPSFPGTFAAQTLKIPTILHEQNAVLGKANIWLADGASAIATSLPGTAGIKEKNLSKVTHTGNPVRAAILALRDQRYLPPEKDFRVLITGGSQGASIFSDVVPDAVARLPRELQERLDIVHQCRQETLEDTQKKYAMTHARTEIKSFFNDMADRLKNCHLFVGRSGASTVAEVSVVGRPAIFVPYRHVDMQQKFNAESLSAAGGAWVVMQEDFTPDYLAAKLEVLMKNPGLLDSAAQAAKNCGQANATQKLATLVEERLWIKKR